MNWYRWNWLHRLLTGYNHPSVTVEAFRRAEESVQEDELRIWGPGGRSGFFAEWDRKLAAVLEYAEQERKRVKGA